MKRIPAIVMFLLGCLLPLSAQIRPGTVLDDLGDSEAVAAIKTHVRTLSAAAMEGRKAGSDGETRSAAYVESVLKGYGVEVLSPEGGELFGVRPEGGDTLTSRNVVGFIQGYDRTMGQRYIVIGARLDNLGSDTFAVDGENRERIYYGANGNASGIAALLEVARMLQTNRILLRRSVLLVAFGASRESFAGSWYFLNRSFGDAARIDGMINLDMLGMGYTGFYAYTASNADLNDMVKAVSLDLNPVTPALVTEEPYPSDNKVFYDREIPSVYFTTGRYAEHDTPRDTQSILDYSGLEKEVEYIYNFSKYMVNAPAASFRPSPESRKQRSGDSGVLSFYECDARPTFLGSADPAVFLQKWVYSYLKYPKEAVENGIQGKVMVDFVIDASGNVGNVTVSRGVDPLLDEEAVRVIAASPKWRPGRYMGRKVSVALSLPVEFRLEKKGSFGVNGHRIGKKK